MALSNAYLSQVKNLSAILQAIRQAQPPERFTHKFLEGLDFKSTNDRGIIGVLKALGFIDESGTPKQPYFDYLDDERHRAVLADGIRRAYADLFKLNNKANEKDAAWVKNKLKMLTQGAKSEAVLTKMTMTFVALCKEADFSTPGTALKEAKDGAVTEPPVAAPSLQNKKITSRNIDSPLHIISISSCLRFETKPFTTQSSNLCGKICSDASSRRYANSRLRIQRPSCCGNRVAAE